MVQLEVDAATGTTKLVKTCERDDVDEDKAEELDDKTRHQYLTVLQYLQAHDLLETLMAMEKETGVRLDDALLLPAANELEASLDMFACYRKKKSGETTSEEELLQVETGVCCTSLDAASPSEPLGANVIAVCWAALNADDFVAIVSTADKKLRVLGSKGELFGEVSNLPAPVLSLDVASVDVAEASRELDVLATTMGGDSLLLKLERPSSEGSGEWALEIVQRFKDHTKHVSSGKFAPLQEGASTSAHFVTTSRDHSAKIYERTGKEFKLRTSVSLVGEGTCCCWVAHNVFVLAVRDDHCLHYWKVDESTGPKELVKTNMNATGDKVVSFTVLGLASSPDGMLVAAVTDKSRVIVLRSRTDRQVQNLYGTVVDGYDMPTLCFSQDRSFLYVTSATLPTKRAGVDDVAIADAAMTGEVVVFEVRTGEAVLRLSCHAKPVRCMQRHPYAEALVTGSFDKTVKFWT